MIAKRTGCRRGRILVFKHRRLARFRMHIADPFLDRDELLTTVCPVWPKPGTNQNHSWLLKDMIAAVKAGSYAPPDVAKVQGLAADMKANPPKELGPLVGYQCPNSIHLEDGTNRVTAAGVADVITRDGSHIHRCSPSRIALTRGCNSFSGLAASSRRRLQAS